MAGMKARISWALSAAAAAIGGPASAQPPGADIFCAQLVRLVRAAAEDEPFASIERSRAARPRFGFAEDCRAEGTGRHRSWLCSQSMAPDTLSIQSLAARTRACLPEAEQVIFATWRETLFMLPHAIIHITEMDGPGADGGRIVSYAVEAIDVAASPASPAGPSE